MKTRMWLTGVAVGLGILLGACGKPAEPAVPPSGAGSEGAHAQRTVRIGLIAKSQSNPVFQAARQGAVDAARELGPKYGVKVEILWQTPVEEDAQEQADKIEQLANQGVDGIAISCSEAGKVTPAIRNAIENRGVKVMCFDSDAPDSGRFVFHGVDDVKCGRQVMEELAKLLDGKGKVAVLAGNQTAPNLQKRVEGIKEVAAQYPGIQIVDVFYHKETPQDAAAKVEQVMQTYPDINGWAMAGGWPLFTSNALKWEPGTVKCVSVDALPPQLAYLESGHVQMLLAQQVYLWGHRSVELLLDNIVQGKVPANGLDLAELVPVTKENVAEYAKNWEKWLPK
jgi:ribose transport system substrate-binding protein